MPDWNVAVGYIRTPLFRKHLQVSRGDDSRYQSALAGPENRFSQQPALSNQCPEFLVFGARSRFIDLRNDPSVFGERR